MKKLLAILLALVMTLSVAAMAEETLDAAQSVADQTQAVYDELVVGSTTALSGRVMVWVLPTESFSAS